MWISEDTEQKWIIKSKAAPCLLFCVKYSEKLLPEQAYVNHGLECLLENMMKDIGDSQQDT